MMKENMDLETQIMTLMRPKIEHTVYCYSTLGLLFKSSNFCLDLGLSHVWKWVGVAENKVSCLGRGNVQSASIEWS